MSRNFEEFAEALKSRNSLTYFWGKISREEAENILAEKPIGSYLIREMECRIKEHNRGFENFEGFVKWQTCIASFPLCGYCPDCHEVLAGYTINAKTQEGHTYQAVNWNRPFTLQELSSSKILLNFHRSTDPEDGIIRLKFLGGHRHEIPDFTKAHPEYPEEEIPKTK